MPLSKSRSSTLVGLRYPVVNLQEVLKAGSIFMAHDDLLHTAEAYSAVE